MRKAGTIKHELQVLQNLLNYRSVHVRYLY